MRIKYEENISGIELIKVEDGYQLCTKKEYYEYIYPLFDNRSKPSISNAALETLSIIAYNPKITRSEIDAIRGVNSDGTIYKLLEYNLIEEAGRLDAPGKPTMYKVTKNFLKMFGISSLDDLPELPKYKLDENEQIVIDDVISEKSQNVELDVLEKQDENIDKKEENDEINEAPMPV
jgi:segregation and condensation protein B